MSTSVHLFIGLQSQLFFQRKFEALAETYAFPLVVHVDDEMIHYRSAADFIPHVRQVRDHLEKNGVKRIVPQIVAVELPHKARFRVWATWSYLREDGSEYDKSRCVYFVSILDGRYVIEMSSHERYVAGTNPKPKQKHQLA
jgi:hypothetical protein